MSQIKKKIEKMSRIKASNPKPLVRLKRPDSHMIELNCDVAKDKIELKAWIGIICRDYEEKLIGGINKKIECSEVLVVEGLVVKEVVKQARRKVVQDSFEIDVKVVFEGFQFLKQVLW